MTRVWHYDGKNAVRRDAEIVADSDGFRLRLDPQSGDGEFYRWNALIGQGEKNGGAVYGLMDRPGWQIGFAGAAPDAIAAVLPKPAKYGGWIDRIGLGPASVGFVAISAAVLFVGLKAPDLIAPFVPLSWEKKMGDAMVGDLGGRFCNGPGGQAALDALAKRIDPTGSPLEVRVANINMVNAVALPGGKIVIFRGLLQEAKSPDELAGVVGHEMGHVRHRDVMQGLLRQAGLSVLLGGFNGNSGGYASALVSATYSREAEANADAYSIGLMKQANVSPADTAGFFARLAGDEAKLGKASAALGYVSSHPLSKSREAVFRNSAVAGASYRAAITPTQWRALVETCRNDPHVEKDDGLFF